MSDSDSEAAAVPADVLEAINLTRNEAHLPHVSIHKDRDGDVKLNVRPPLHAAWNQFFWQKRWAQLQDEEKAVELLPQCTFCRDYMHHETQLLEALACGHTFHEKCLRDYCAGTKREKADACPFKCNVQGNGDEQLVAGLLASREHEQLVAGLQVAAGPSGISTSSSSSVVEDSQEIGDRVLE